jgi:hypothetical protein
MSGMSEITMAAKMGLLHGTSVRRVPWGWRLEKTKRDSAVKKLRKMERDMANARLSTFQRYARVLGIQLNTALVLQKRHLVAQRACAVRHHRKVLAQRYGRQRRPAKTSRCNPLRAASGRDYAIIF